MKIQMRVTGLNELEKSLQGLIKDGIRQADDKGREALSKAVKDEVIKGYQSAAFNKTQGTQEAYSQGKSAGNSPARFSWAGKALQRSGQLMKSVVNRKVGKKWKIQIKPRAMYGGDPADAARKLSVAYIATQLENPKPYVLRVTRAMNAYLQLLREGLAGRQSSSTGNTQQGQDLTGRVISITPTARPVWRPAYEKIPSIFSVYMKAFRKHLESLSFK